MIEKKIHFVWVGDESLRPDSCIDSWSAMNPEYSIRIWGNDDLISTSWYLGDWIRAMSDHELCGVADLMRYEILFREGGVALDADCTCIRPLDDWLLMTSDFACWENEHAVPGLIGVGALGATRGSLFFKNIMKEFLSSEVKIDSRAWICTGPVRLTNSWRRQLYPLTIYPSHFFYPNHHSGQYSYNGQGLSFANQYWCSTYGSYEVA